MVRTSTICSIILLLSSCRFFQDNALVSVANFHYLAAVLSRQGRVGHGIRAKRKYIKPFSLIGWAKVTEHKNIFTIVAYRFVPTDIKSGFSHCFSPNRDECMLYVRRRSSDRCALDHIFFYGKRGATFSRVACLSARGLTIHPTTRPLFRTKALGRRYLIGPLITRALLKRHMTAGARGWGGRKITKKFA